MKITKQLVEKIIISSVPDLDPIAIYFEDFNPGQGKATITCFNESWSYCWGAMGEKQTIKSFLLKCDQHYLCGKFAPFLNDRIDDPGKLEAEAKKRIIEDRLEGLHTEEKARELYDQASHLQDLYQEFNGSGGETYTDLMYDIFGDEFWHNVPKKTNPKYEYLCRIINTIKEALRQKENPL